MAQDLSIYGGTALQYHTKNDDGPKKIDLNGYLEMEYAAFTAASGPGGRLGRL